MLQPTQVIIKPLVTEKGAWESQARNRYRFQVHQDANKTMIRDAVQHIYKVDVEAVSTQNRKGVSRRTRFGAFQWGRMKMAIVQVKEGQKIELF